jgi:hypothetical protein
MIKELNRALPGLSEQAERARQSLDELTRQFESTRLQNRQELDSIFAKVEQLRGTDDWSVLVGLLGRRTLLEHAKVVDCLGRLRTNAKMCNTRGEMSLSMALTSDFRELVGRYAIRPVRLCLGFLRRVVLVTRLRPGHSLCFAVALPDCSRLGLLQG